MAQQGKDKAATNDVPRQRRPGEDHPEITPRQLAGEHQIRDLRRTHDDVSEVAERHEVGDDDRPGERGHAAQQTLQQQLAS